MGVSTSTTTTTLTFSGKVTVADLKGALEELPSTATVSIQSHRGDRPGESDWHTMTVTHSG